MLGHALAYRPNSEHCMEHRIKKAWATAHANKSILRCSAISPGRRSQLLNTLVKPSLLYASETRIWTPSLLHKVITTERALSRWCLKPFHVKPEETDLDEERKTRKATDNWVQWRRTTARRGGASLSKQNNTPPWAVQAMKQVWKWAGHIASHDITSGTRASTDPPTRRATRSRPPTTWDSVFRRFAKQGLLTE